MNFRDLGDLMVMTLRNPAQGVAMLRGLDLSMAERWLMLVLAVCLSTLLAGLARQLFPPSTEDALSAFLSVPMWLAVLQFGAMIVSAVVITVIGRAFGGHGTFEDAILLIAWVELILVGLQAMQIVLMLIMPGSAALMSMVAFGISVYLTISMTKALHGFESVAKVTLGFIGTVFVLGFVLSVIAAAFGIFPEVAP
ncbi:YIP1 family protein [Paracoccus shanxieyensis]|uniref:YIP1 family protein n=1 Tax=Paracoccus shanxieyensis TaxID=2675752 RepID=A0A6L6IXJ5_9RHOB|nr:YIP1 family protein [Paracoccus shanxieyensis]MTH63770.1 YIP1 family protein [Paracoccus shanxieyensis]MTH86719.1 YIP1 family protein [Paracoccus shanxieyensis]